MDPDSMWAVDMELGDTAMVTSERRALFDWSGFTSLQGFGVVAYAIDPATGRFLMIKPVGSVAGADEAVGQPHIKVVLNWFEELRERVPTGGR